MAVQKQRRLGRGLSGLIQGTAPAEVTPPVAVNTGVTTGIEIAPDNSSQPSVDGITMVEVDAVRASPFQPRRVFDERALDQLAASIARAGLMQPIIVRPVGSGYELVAGERRWRAATRAGLVSIPALVRDLADGDAAEWALIENIQREDLNPIERAHGLAALADRNGLSHAQVGERVGLERSTVANLIRLTELEDEIQAMVASGALLMGHARALLGVSAGRSRVSLAKRAASEGWNVRQVEAAARGGSGSDQTRTREPNATPTQRQAVIADIERRLSDHLGTRVQITMGASGTKGRLQVAFYSLAQFEGLMERMGLADEPAV